MMLQVERTFDGVQWVVWSDDLCWYGSGVTEEEALDNFAELYKDYWRLLHKEKCLGPEMLRIKELMDKHTDETWTGKYGQENL